MAIVSHAEAERFSAVNGEWFSLKNDGDVARVQFMYDSYDDITEITAHKIKIGEKERYVDCLRPSYDSPIDMCPLCAAGYKVTPVRFIIMYQHDDGKVKIWERGPQFLKKLQGLFNRYPDLSNHVFEIERHGNAGDKKTSYEVWPMEKVEPFDLTEVEMPDLMKGLVLVKTADDMEEFLETGSFAESEDDKPAKPERHTETRGAVRRVPVTQSSDDARPRSSRAQVSPPVATGSPTPGSRRGVLAPDKKNTEVF